MTTHRIPVPPVTAPAVPVAGPERGSRGPGLRWFLLVWLGTLQDQYIGYAFSYPANRYRPSTGY
jgi:hypothetical protein